MPSQHSYENRLGRFENGTSLLKTYADYVPANSLITTASLDAFAVTVRGKNDEVETLYVTLTDKRNLRKPIVFRSKIADVNCLQNRVSSIASYLKAEFGKTSGAYKKVYSLLKKMSPSYPKKTDPTLPKGSGRSPSERSFVAVTGYAFEIIAILNTLGVVYNPGNDAIKLANFETFVENLKTLNEEIAVALKDYGEAVLEREKLYNASDGLTSRVALIKEYLASFEGGKKNPMYIEYSQAIKGV